MRIAKNLIYFTLIFLTFQSCKKSPDPLAVRNSVVDSTIVLFTKSLYKNQVDSVIAKNKFNGSISIAQNGEKLYEKESGYGDFQAKTKLDSNSVFAIASVSKQFTAVLILLQQEAGKLNVNDKASKYLADFQKPNFEKVTIHQLLNHTSGLNDFGENLQFESGSDYSYSNKGYNYLGEIVAKVSGKSFDQNVKGLFQKAGMKHSSTAGLFQGTDLAGANIGTLENAQKVENMPKRLAEKSIGTAAGGILSTINDLHRWNAALYSGKILKPESLAAFRKNYVTRKHYVLGNVGYGYGIMSNIGKPEAYFHTGYVKGAPSLLIYYPGTNTSVVILSNFANESRGKESIFVPHRRVKDITDAVESTVVELRKEMIR
ncbi:beta-lactamase family protein [Chryseobacterium taklimakanense]|uniref:serine hydrolase domain-containing protein n=1 Tax=Chryseobacterium taklimakanense TaxID=536441 RepID=UPI001EF4F825|nr:serine hydrolase domain-containing protein [Chryseobacterium taklimakanense]MCG7280950.1 beta-lactamase family protein [Chryseobacterium taklimakanense]